MIKRDTCNRISDTHQLNLSHFDVTSEELLMRLSERAQDQKSPDCRVAGLVLSALHSVKSDPDTAAESILKAFPVISLLRDARSYGGHDAEVRRTLKSLLVLARFVMDDRAGLGGEKADAMSQGLHTLRRLVLKGLYELGHSDNSPDLSLSLCTGLLRMAAILSVHDLAKSKLVGDTAEAELGCSDHDHALAALAKNSFNVLRTKISDDEMAALDQIMQDPVVADFFAKPRDIAGFNPGRHLQGEAPCNLFTATVRGISSSALAEFILDWGGVNGHQELTGPLALSHIPPAINGTASALQLLSETPGNTRDELWMNFSYPIDVRMKLGLEVSSPSEIAITRVAFMGREHQNPDHDAALVNITALRKAFASLPASLKDQLEQELCADDLDLGFTPHTIAALREKTREAGMTLTPQITEKIYATFLLSLHRTIEQARALKPEGQVITINFDNKDAKLSDSIGSRIATNMSALELVSGIDIGVSRDVQGVIKATFANISSAEDAPLLVPSLDLATINAKNILVGGHGGGGDIFQAAVVKMMLEGVGKNVVGVFSVRRGKVADVESNLRGAVLISEANGIFKITPDVTGVIGTTSRLPERGVSKGTGSPVYLIVDENRGETLHEQLTWLSNYLSNETANKVDGIIGIDTGGDILYPLNSNEANDAHGTPDQDHASLVALSRMEGIAVYSGVIGLGIDSRAELLKDAAEIKAAACLPPSSEVHEAITHFYNRSGLGEDESVFSRTSLVVREVMSGAVSGPEYVYVDGIPLRLRISRDNPWLSWVRATPDMGTLVLMTVEDNLRLISGKSSSPSSLVADLQHGIERLQRDGSEQAKFSFATAGAELRSLPQSEIDLVMRQLPADARPAIVNLPRGSELRQSIERLLQPANLLELQTRHESATHFIVDIGASALVIPATSVTVNFEEVYNQAMKAIIRRECANRPDIQVERYIESKKEILRAADCLYDNKEIWARLGAPDVSDISDSLILEAEETGGRVILECSSISDKAEALRKAGHPVYFTGKAEQVHYQRRVLQPKWIIVPSHIDESTLGCSKSKVVTREMPAPTPEHWLSVLAYARLDKGRQPGGSENLYAYTSEDGTLVGSRGASIKVFRDDWYGNVGYKHVGAARLRRPRK